MILIKAIMKKLLTFDQLVKDEVINTKQRDRLQEEI